MNKNKIVTAIAVLLLVIVLLTIVNFLNNKTGQLISPGMRKEPGQIAKPLPTLTPEPSFYNPPKAIEYNSSTNLKEVLDSIDPKVLESDFKDL